jgi:hypothetical protein
MNTGQCVSKTLENIQGLAETGDILISEHGYDEQPFQGDNYSLISRS